jgi:hypothetical protein
MELGGQGGVCVSRGPEKGAAVNCCERRNSLSRRELRLDLHDFTTHVVTASRANRVRRDRRAALRAAFDLDYLLGVMRATLAGTGVRVFSFWDCHLTTFTNSFITIEADHPLFSK